jgi:hypothetical protein
VQTENGGNFFEKAVQQSRNEQQRCGLPKQLYVVVLWCSIDDQHPRFKVKDDFSKLMTFFNNDSYGILIEGNDMFYGCVGYVDEPLALPLNLVFGLNQVGVWCTHDFVDTLKSYRRKCRQTGDRDVLDIVVYKNPRTKMTNKSCNNYCLKNVEPVPECNLLQLVVQNSVEDQNMNQ